MLPTPRVSDCLELSHYIDKLVQDAETFISDSTLRDLVLKPVKTPEMCLKKRTSSNPDNPPKTSGLFCLECSKSFKNKQGLKQHIGRIHSNNFKKKVCLLCEKRFKNKHALRFHIAQVHNKTTRVECDECSSSFYNKYELKKHKNKEHFIPINQS